MDLPSLNRPSRRVTRAIEAGARLSASHPDAIEPVRHPAWLLNQVLLPLRSAHSIERYPYQGDLITVEDLLRVMNLNSEGFTVAPVTGTTGVFKFAEAGYCVALPGVACLVDPASESETTTGSELQAWVTGLRMALLSQCAWLGGYLWQQGPDKGKFEVAVSVVFRQDRLGDAALALESWDQLSLFAIDPQHPDDSREITQAALSEHP